MKRKLTFVETFLWFTPPLALGLTMYWYFDPPWLEDALFRRSPSDAALERLVRRTAGSGAVDCGAADAGSSAVVSSHLIVSSPQLDRADGCAISNFQAKRAFRVSYSAYMGPKSGAVALNGFSEVRAWSPRKGMVILRHGAYMQNAQYYVYGVRRCSSPKIGYAYTWLPNGFEAGHKTVGCP